MRVVHSLAVLPLLAAPLAAQADVTLRPCARGLGQPVQYQLGNGKARLPFLFLSSLQRGSFPLSAIDSRDSRVVGVGLDLLGLAVIGLFDANGGAKFGFMLPNDASLAGRSLLHQVLAFPGTSTLFGAMSEVAVIPLEVAGAWRTYPQNVMQDERAWVNWLPLRDGRVLFCGGGRGALLALQAFKSTSIYDPATRTFTNGPDMTQDRGVFTASAIDGGALLAGGVDTKNDPQNTAEIYDPKTNTFQAVAPMANKRMAHAATTLSDGRVFVTGGLSDLNGQLQAIGSALSATELYDPKAAAWTKGPDLSEPKAGHSAVLLADGRVILLGGITWRSIIGLKLPSFSARAEVFDPATGKIVQLRDMATARAGHAAAVLPGGRVLAAGGVGGSVLTGGSPLSSCEIYDIAANTWQPVASLASARGLMGVTFLEDGRLALVGGAAGSLLAPVGVTDCEALDPASGTWQTLPPLSTPRASHATILLNSCALLVVGGGQGGAGGGALKTQELLYR